MDRAYPFTIRDGVNDTSIKELQYLLLHYIHHERIEPPLGFPCRFRPFFHIYMMHASGRA
ncbi:hypothetical protein Syun_003712 [Stephania yunnanensis]|uniref:Uncharacterized protein n=1 Tax=Stephania yunnanensis TaxID=152371 RepID=A0AAP0L4A0_9MAGN